MKLIDQALIRKLKEKGVEESLIPGFLRILANALMISPSMSAGHLNQRLSYLGWDDVELDWRTMELARAFFEAKGISNLEYRAAPWYVNSNGSEVTVV